MKKSKGLIIEVVIHHAFTLFSNFLPLATPLLFQNKKYEP